MSSILKKNRNALDTNGFKEGADTPHNADLDEKPLTPKVKRKKPVESETESLGRTVRLTVEIPEDIHDKLKFASYSSKKSMKTLVTAYLKRELGAEGYLND